ncbi:MAG: hypothetical protein WCA35_08880 [Kovacikia sp.]
MKRLLYLATQPSSWAKELAAQTRLEVITPTRVAARALGKGQKPLPTLAREILLAQGLTIAPPLNAHQALRQAIRQILVVKDIEGTARTWMPTVQTFMRSSRSFDLDLENLSTRVKQLIQVTQAYQTILRQQHSWMIVKFYGEP